MDERASIRPGLPASCPTTSFWQTPPSHLADHRSTTKLPAKTDVIIIGSGISGAFLAHGLVTQASPPSTLMLEARTACSGATGRNGGHTKHAAYREFLDNMKNLGEKEAAKIARFTYDCMRNVHEFSQQHNIQCDSWQGDTVDVFYDAGQFEKARMAVSEMKRVLGEEDPAARYNIWNAEAARRKFLVEGSYGAMSYEAGSLWPYKLVIGILELAIKNGLNLQNRTPALQLTRVEDQDCWLVHTPRGEVRASKVLLATNSYTARLCPALQGVIVPLRGHMTVQRPGSSLPRDGLSTTYSFIYDDGYEYMISRPQGTTFAGDIMIGGGSTKAPEKGIREFGSVDDTTIEPTILNYLKDSAATRFGSNWGSDHPDGRIRDAWTGIMGYAADGFPFIGEVPDHHRLYVAASFQGLGMVLCFNAAKALLSIVNEEDEENLDSWFPTAFRITNARTKHKFRGRLHTTTASMELEIKSQS